MASEGIIKHRVLILLFSAASVAGVGIAVAPSEWFGWLLMLLSFICVVLVPAVRSSKFILIAIVTVVAAHHFVSFINAFVTPLPGTQLDAKAFHVAAMSRSLSTEPTAFGIGTHAYQYVLVQLYSIAGGSLFLGQELSVLVATIACVVFVLMLRSLQVAHTACAFLVLVFGLVPSFVLYTSTTMREGFQVLFFLAGCAVFLRALQSQSQWLLIVGCLMFLVMGLFHQVLMVYAFFAVTVAASLYLATSLDARNLRRSAIFIGVVLGLILWCSWYWIPVHEGNDYSRMVYGGLPESIVRYREGIMGADPRSAYGFHVVAAPLWEFVATLAKSYLHYMFGPFAVSSSLDFFAVAESLLRMVGLGAMFYALARAGGQTRVALIGLLLLYAGMTMLWSVGTTNYGQAFRHHTLSNWILLVGAGVAWSLFAGRRKACLPFSVQ